MTDQELKARAMSAHIADQVRNAQRLQLAGALLAPLLVEFSYLSDPEGLDTMVPESDLVRFALRFADALMSEARKPPVPVAFPSTAREQAAE